MWGMEADACGGLKPQKRRSAFSYGKLELSVGRRSEHYLVVIFFQYTTTVKWPEFLFVPQCEYGRKAEQSWWSALWYRPLPQGLNWRLFVLGLFCYNLGIIVGSVFWLSWWLAVVGHGLFSGQVIWGIIFLWIFDSWILPSCCASPHGWDCCGALGGELMVSVIVVLSSPWLVGKQREWRRRTRGPSIWRGGDEVDSTAICISRTQWGP